VTSRATLAPTGGFIARLRRRASAIGARIGFPESDEPRTAEAIVALGGEGWVAPVSFDGESALSRSLEALADGELEGVVAGASTSTATVIRAGLRILGVAPGFETVSSAFYMIVGEGEAERVLSFTDPGVVPEPTAAQLSESAEAAARARTMIVGDEPRVAFLSYSTKGSASGPSVDRVRAGLEAFRARCPDVLVDGELQADAALIDSVAEHKAPGSQVAGSANVLVFPDLDSGNISYKLVQRLTGGRALGPILQGLAAPLNDLSRGASVADIVDVACITAIMSEGEDPGWVSR